MGWSGSLIGIDTNNNHFKALMGVDIQSSAPTTINFNFNSFVGEIGYNEVVDVEATLNSDGTFGTWSDSGTSFYLQGQFIQDGGGVVGRLRNLSSGNVSIDRGVLAGWRDY